MVSNAMQARICWAVIAAAYALAVSDSGAMLAVYALLWWIGDFLLELFI